MFIKVLYFTSLALLTEKLYFCGVFRVLLMFAFSAITARTHTLILVGALLLLSQRAAASPPDSAAAPGFAARAAILSRLMAGALGTAPAARSRPWYRQVRVAPFTRANGYGLTLKYRW